ncbi:MAG: hypothetical protein JWR00_4436 [Rubritepida sp.]|nr:hypothetical protein [Rubritepida sp.]
MIPTFSTDNASGSVGQSDHHGTPRNIVSADGRGEANPIAPTDTPDGHAQNRRIEITLAGPGN